MYPTGGYQGHRNDNTTEIYPINKTMDQKRTGHLIHGGNTNMISVVGCTTTIYALGTGTHIQRNVEVWDPNDQKWAMAPTEYQMKTGRAWFGALAVPRDIVC